MMIDFFVEQINLTADCFASLVNSFFIVVNVSYVTINSCGQDSIFFTKSNYKIGIYKL